MRNQKGITLIALVITIIVLLILAGVSIAMLSGENGILTNASEAQAKTDYNNAVEKINVALQAIKTEALANTVDDNTYDPTTEDNMEALTAEAVIGEGMTEDDGYAITPAAGVITISYENTATQVEVEGSIDFTVDGALSGKITAATGTIPGEPQ